jgi:two-component system chemotaxis sensor kinase CheA
MGNDPLHIFRALAEMGELTAEVDTSSLPEFDEYEADKLYLSWVLVLKTTVGEAEVREAFDWVENHCVLEIENLNASDNIAEVAAESAEVPEPSAESAQPEATDADEPPKEKERKLTAETTSLRVGIDKIDNLINLVGELVITQSMLGQMGESIETCDTEMLREGFAQLERNTRELQENVMRIRMVPVSHIFNRLPRMIHDLGAKLDKRIDLQMSGEQTEMDKTVLEKIGDPLVHLVRNAVDHGIETPAVRKAAGKPETGVVHLNAFHAGGNIVIEITDDGAGLNTDRILEKAREKGLIGKNENPSEATIHELLFHPGFSTAEVVSDVSGRGVGMDVVKRNIQAVGGHVEIATEPGKGSVFTIRLPLTLAIMDGQLVNVASQVFVVPLTSIVESIQLKDENINSVADRGRLYRIRGDYIPIVSLAELFGIPIPEDKPSEPLIVVVESGLGKVGLLVDDLLAQQQVVIKSLETNYQRVQGVSGATILGDGTVALIADVAGIVGLARGGSKINASGSDPAGATTQAA